jgi:hypothetical protein
VLLAGTLAVVVPSLTTGQADSAAAPRPPRVWIRPVASLVAPGAGQLLAGQDRGAVFAAVEVYLLARFIQLQREARSEADRFRSLAYGVARRAFMPVGRDTVFEYYEVMERFPSSGGYDADPGPGFTPELDASTYNGSVWLLARRTFWQDPAVPPNPASPEYQRALQFYQDRAIGVGYLWSWQGASLEHDVFRQAIRRSDAAYRGAQNQLGMLLANHVLSAVDALISSRLTAATGRRASLHSFVGRRRSHVVVRLSF